MITDSEAKKEKSQLGNNRFRSGKVKSQFGNWIVKFSVLMCDT